MGEQPLSTESKALFRVSRKKHRTQEGSTKDSQKAAVKDF